jgi:hypothetical protein
MKILFLDDNAERHKRFMMNRIGMDVTQVWNYDEACKALSETVFDIAHLDHDLSDLAAANMAPEDEKTGTDVAEFIAAMPEDKRPKYVVIHSFNYSGRQRMAGILSAAGVSCVMEMFKG